MSGVVQRVDENVNSTPEDEYKSLLRSLRRRRGFGLTFVRCSPAGGVELIQKVRDDLPQKQIGVLELQEPIDNLIERVESFPDQENLNILFVVGLEKSLEEYIRSGYGGEGDYYNMDKIPPILNHLNWQRENFRDRFRHLCFVFLLPQFAIKYISRRAPDFFDWGTGVFEFKDKEILDLSYPRTLAQRELNQKLSVIYPLITLVQIILVIISTIKYIPLYIVLIVLFGIIITNFWQLRNNQLLVDVPLKEFTVEALQKFPLISFTRSEIYVRQGKLLENLGRYEDAISFYDKALRIKPNYHEAWYKKGCLLDDLHRYEEAIESYDKALKIKYNDSKIWFFRGNTLVDLSRYEEAIVSYDKALQFESRLRYLPRLLSRYLPWLLEDRIWYFRGYALCNLSRYEEEIISYDKVLQNNPNKYRIWKSRGFALYNLGRNEEALASYDKALQIDSNNDTTWLIRGNILENLGRREEAIKSYQKVLQINPKNIYAWALQGLTLTNLGRKKEAVTSYEKALQIKPSNHQEWKIRGIILRQMGRYNEAILSCDNALQSDSNSSITYYEKACIYSLQSIVDLTVYNLQKAIHLNPDKYRELARTDSAFDNIRHDPRFQALIQ